jgi:type IV secretory pathway VirB6-like protein
MKADGTHIMNLRRLSFCRYLGFVVVACGLFFAPMALASGGGTSGLCSQNGSNGAYSLCNACVSSSVYNNLFSGNEIINTMFTGINKALDTVEYSFFNGIINGTGFQAVVGTAVLIYVAMYGLMIMFNITSYRVSEIVTRLLKIAIVYMMTSPTAWTHFNTWVNIPVVGGMNEIIQEFTKTAEGISDPTTIQITNGAGASTSGMGLDPAAFSVMFGSSMTIVYSVKMYVAIMSLAGTGFFGWIVAIFLAWSLVEFMLMIIGAIVTYAKAIIGLAFLFGVAPIFFIFLLFDKTRVIFMSWASQVLSFVLQPILLFAFLSFYLALVTQAVNNLFLDPSRTPQSKVMTDYCWVKWLSMPGSLFDPSFWRPTRNGATVSDAWNDNQTGKTYSEPLVLSTTLYFLMICHLGNMFSKYIATLAGDLTNAMGPGVVRGADVAQGIQNLASKAGKNIRGK